MMKLFILLLLCGWRHCEPHHQSVCGDGVIDGNEQCDSGGLDTAVCNGSICTVAVCGDGYYNPAADMNCEAP